MAAPDVEPAERITARKTGSFAYLTARDRLPVHVTKVIDLLSRKAPEFEEKFGEAGREEVKQVTGSIAKLRNELQTNKDFLRLEDSYQDVSIWNDQLAKEPNPRYYEATWLFAECYTYRRLYEAFQLTKNLKTYDYFSEMKTNALVTSLAAIDVLTEAVSSSGVTLAQRLEIALWGNQCDLALTEDRKKSRKADPIDHLDELRPKILQNDIAQVEDYIQTRKNLTIHYILDNAGFELVTDLILLDFLMRQGHVGRVEIFVKKFPWFVSDTLVHDFQQTLDFLSTSKTPATSALSQRCRTYFAGKKWTIVESSYWTLPFDFAEMRSRDSTLYARLSAADLIVFKGDLNYRKLVGDRSWKPETSFDVALMGFKPAPLLALRTIKAETVAGLRNGVAEATAEKAKDWMATGEFAVAQFYRP